MIYPMVPFQVTLSDPSPRFQGHRVIFMPIDALSVFYAQLTRDLLAIAKFLFKYNFRSFAAPRKCRLVHEIQEALLSQRGLAMLRVCQ